jgi:hypothetical protein
MGTASLRFCTRNSEQTAAKEEILWTDIRSPLTTIA